MLVYLVRHTESKAQTEEEYSLDANLSDFGVAQAKLLKDRIGKVSFDKAFISPLKRARQTFEFSTASSDAICFDSRIVEELPAGMYQDNILPYEATPNYGKDDIQVAWEVSPNVRVKNFLNDLFSEKGSGIVLVVAHAGTLNWMMNLVANPDCVNRLCKFHMDNGAVSILEIDAEGQGKVLCWNDTYHLG